MKTIATLPPCPCGGLPQYRLFGALRRTYVCCSYCDAETPPFIDKVKAENAWRQVVVFYKPLSKGY